MPRLKAGLNTMTVGFAKAFGPTVRVNCIMPGPFYTDIADAWDRDAVAAHLAATHALRPRRRGGRDRRRRALPRQRLSSFTTGAILRVDGGMP